MRNINKIRAISHAFGTILDGRTYGNIGRHAFNGKEFDSETSTQDYGMRIYNPALGRFLSVAPLSKKFPWYTPYQFAGNKPIWAIDLDGLEETAYTMRMDRQYATIEGATEANKVARETAPFMVAAVALGLAPEFAPQVFAIMRPFLATAITGATVSGGISALKGESGYDIFKSTEPPTSNPKPPHCAANTTATRWCGSCHFSLEWGWWHCCSACTGRWRWCFLGCSSPGFIG